jgi:MarR family transcriptional regulator, organic hydroperoxide resistance regulator
MRKQRDVHDLAQEIDSSLREIQRALRKPLSAAIARGELTAPQRAIMAILVRSDGLSLKELSRRAGLAHSTVSGIVDRLEKREMVTRQPDETDGRFSRIVVTEVVRDFVRDKLPELAIQPLVEALERSSAAQRKKIAGGLRTLRAALGER